MGAVVQMGRGSFYHLQCVVALYLTADIRELIHPEYLHTVPLPSILIQMVPLHDLRLLLIHLALLLFDSLQKFAMV